MTACFCGRSPRGFAWHDLKTPPMDRKPPVLCCSMKHMEIAAKRKGNMELNVDEKRAVRAASAEVGEYLEHIGKTDLAAMTEEEWLGFIAHTYYNVCLKVGAIWEEEVPF